jgi:hypothetical protein
VSAAPDIVHAAAPLREAVRVVSAAPDIADQAALLHEAVRP